MKRIYLQLSRASPRSQGLLAFSFLPFHVKGMAGGRSGSGNAGPLCVFLSYPPHSLVVNKARAVRGPWGSGSVQSGQLPKLAHSEGWSLIVLPERFKFKGNLYIFWSCLVSSISLILNAATLQSVSAFLQGNVCFCLGTLHPPVHPLHFLTPSFCWKSLGHLSLPFGFLPLWRLRAQCTA